MNIWGSFFKVMLPDNTVKCRRCRRWVPPVSDGTCTKCNEQDDTNERKRIN